MVKKEVKILKLMFFLYPVFASLASFLLRANFLVSTLIFFGIPSLILSFKDKNLIKKAALFSACFGFPLTIIIDYIATLTRTWFVPKSIFPVRIFGLVALEMFLWGFLYIRNSQLTQCHPK